MGSLYLHGFQNPTGFGVFWQERLKQQQKRLDAEKRARKKEEREERAAEKAQAKAAARAKAKAKAQPKAKPQAKGATKQARPLSKRSPPSGSLEGTALLRLKLRNSNLRSDRRRVLPGVLEPSGACNLLKFPELPCLQALPKPMTSSSRPHTFLVTLPKVQTSLDCHVDACRACFTGLLKGRGLKLLATELRAEHVVAKLCRTDTNRCLTSM